MVKLVYHLFIQIKNNSIKSIILFIQCNIEIFIYFIDIILYLLISSSLKVQKRLSASILRCGKKKVWLDPNELGEIGQANSSEYLKKKITKNLSLLHYRLTSKLYMWEGNRSRVKKKRPWRMLYKNYIFRLWNVTSSSIYLLFWKKLMFGRKGIKLFNNGLLRLLVILVFADDLMLIAESSKDSSWE